MRRHRHAVAAALMLGTLIANACVPAEPGPPAPLSPVTVYMDGDWSQGFFSLPWPNEIRTNPDGTLDLAGIPVRGSWILSLLARAAGGEIRGPGTNSAVYVRFTGPIDPTSLPSPLASALPSSPIQLVAADGSGERIPVVARAESADGYREPNLVSLLPYPGHSLRPATRYVVAVTRGVRSADGSPAQASATIARLDGPWAPGVARSAQEWAALRDQRDRAREILATSGTWSADDLVGFSAFTTQDSTALMKAVARGVERFTPTLNIVAAYPCESPGQKSEILGTLTVPTFQQGNTPVTLAGGRIVVDGDGVAVQQAVRTIGVGMTLPCSPPPAGGWPIQTYIDGTGASVRARGGFGDRARSTLIASIAPLYSPAENGSAFSPILFYNLFNPPAVRTNPIQQAADNLTLIKAMRAVSLPPSVGDGVNPVTTRPTNVTVTGHSQGAQTVALVAAMDPEVRTIVTSSATSGQYNSVSYRSDVRQGLAAVVGDAAGLDPRAPVVQAVEMLLDVDESANFPTTGNWLNFVGLNDGCLPYESSRHLAGSQRLAVVNPQVSSIFGDAALDPVVAAPPVSGNGPGGTTRVSVETNGFHQVAFANRDVVAAFIDRATAGLTPVVPAQTFNVAAPDDCPPRFGPIGNSL